MADSNEEVKQAKGEHTPKHTARGDERRRDLIGAAHDIIAESGFDGLRVRDVAARVGMNIATLHYYFTTKEDLVRGVVETLFEQFKTFQLPAPAAQDAAQKLRQEFIDLQHQIKRYPDTFIVLHELRLQARRSPAIKAILSEIDQGWHDYIESLCREGVEMKIFRADLDPDQAAWLVVALISGMQIIDRLDSFDAEQVSDNILRGFRTK